MLPRWVQYYGDQLGQDNLVVLDDNSVDGSTEHLPCTVLRLPRSRITDRHGAPMEMHPRPVDVEVKRPIGESYGAKDSQLDRAVEVLLEEIR